MTINYNVTGAQRKELVTAMGEILEVKPKYLGMPSAAYQVDYFHIDKTGTVTFDDRADAEDVENLIEKLTEKGFVAETTEEPEEQETASDTLTEEVDTLDGEEPADADNEEQTTETSAEETHEPTGLTVSIPLDKVAVGNLTRLLEAKGSLIQKALGIEALPIEIGEEVIAFPWFSELPDADTSAAYTRFIAALCKMSKDQKRITATEKEVANEKYAFRCFLLRLGFIGSEFKTDRKILLQNLSGSSAFKSGARKAATEETSAETAETIENAESEVAQDEH